MNEDKIASQLKQLQELAKQDKNIDVAKLMINALQTSKGNYLTTREKRIAYLVSIGVPFAGFYYAFKFMYSDADDGMEAALACTVLSCVCLIMTWGLTKIALPGNTASELQNLSPQDIYQVVE